MTFFIFPSESTDENLFSSVASDGNSSAMTSLIFLPHNRIARITPLSYTGIIVINAFPNRQKLTHASGLRVSATRALFVYSLNLPPCA